MEGVRSSLVSSGGGQSGEGGGGLEVTEFS